MDALLAISLLIGMGTITPGPNNAIVMAASMRGGFIAARPLIAGVLAGGLMMFAMIWFGALTLIKRSPQFTTLITCAGAAYLGWMGIRMIWTTAQPIKKSDNVAAQKTSTSGRAVGMIMFQFANPKAWTLLIAVTALAARDFPDLKGFTTLTVIFVALSGGSLCTWAAVGSAVSTLVTNARIIQWLERIVGIVFILLATSLTFSVLS